jgi:hypothetical protein
MSDLTQTPANVLAGNPSITGYGLAGAAIVAGNSIYLNTDGYWYPAQANSTSTVAGGLQCAIALDSAPGAAQPFTYQRSGQINLGATLAIGQVYVVAADNAGAIAPYSDLASGNYVTVLGVAVSSSLLLIPGSGPLASGVVHY